MRLSLAFAALVAVVPAFVNASSSGPGTAIPISKRVVPIKDDNGTVNGEALKSLTTSLIKKFKHAFQVYEQNMKNRHPLAIRASGGVFGTDDGSGADPLINDQDVLWHGSISVGTPPVNFTVAFDTGSSDLFLPGPSCGTTCQGHKIYDTAASSTAKDLGEPFKLGFGDGSLVQGEIFTDTVRIAVLTVTNQSVGAASTYPAYLASKQFPPDGLIGMGFPEISAFKTNTFLENWVVQSDTPEGQLSDKLAADESELFATSGQTEGKFKDKLAADESELLATSGQTGGKFKDKLAADESELLATSGQTEGKFKDKLAADESELLATSGQTGGKFKDKLAADESELLATSGRTGGKFKDKLAADESELLATSGQTGGKFKDKLAADESELLATSGRTGGKFKDKLAADESELLATSGQTGGKFKDKLAADESELLATSGQTGGKFKDKLAADESELLATSGQTEGQFSFKLAADESELFLGGSNSDLFTGEFTTLNITQSGFWQVTLDSVSVGSQPAIAGVQAIIHPGAPLIIAPEKDVVKFYEAIPGYKDAANTTGQGFFTLPCDTDPQVSLTFGGKQFKVPVSSLIIGPVTDGSMDCVGAIAGAEDIDFWVVGDVFLSSLYTRFDYVAKQVGFADLA